MEFREMQYFTAVAKEKSFTRAAERLHVTQPTLSKTIRHLEEELGVELFDRQKRQIELTDVGEALLFESELLLRQLEDLPNHVFDITHSKRGQIRLDLPPLIGSLFFTKFLNTFHSFYPDIQVIITEAGGHTLGDALDNGELDVIATVLPAGSAFTEIPFITEELYAYLPVTHPLAVRKQIRLEELAKDAFVLFTEEFSLHHVVREACEQAGFHPQIIEESGQWDFLCLSVAQGNAVTILPRTIMQKMNVHGIRAIPLKRRIPWQLGIATAKGRYMSFASREFIRFLTEEYSFDA
ncbi:LysR family transcriptional regulator [Exiguobacterium sp. s189]|uniref:LysR family transcriptional regulator n=1 Tax=Exiguobacterium sp. s189 TaxID=2751263 RepID=UPI001BE93C48|nr:LysR family transcriptional regulator [Exiguobacterium sp. s189]